MTVLALDQSTVPAPVGATAERRHRGGRPSRFTPEIARTIVARLRLGDSLPAAAKHTGLNYGTVHNWLRQGEQSTEGPFKEFAAEVRRAQTEIKQAARSRLTVDRRRPGRLSLCTVEACQKICYALAVGGSWQLAADYAGVGRSTVDDWIARGQRAVEGPYYDFAIRARKAKASPSIRALAVLNRLALNGHVQAAMVLFKLSHSRLRDQSSIAWLAGAYSVIGAKRASVRLRELLDAETDGPSIACRLEALERADEHLIQSVLAQIDSTMPKLIAELDAAYAQLEREMADLLNSEIEPLVLDELDLAQQISELANVDLTPSMDDLLSIEFEPTDSAVEVDLPSDERSPMEKATASVCALTLLSQLAIEGNVKAALFLFALRRPSVRIAQVHRCRNFADLVLAQLGEMVSVPVARAPRARPTEMNDGDDSRWRLAQRLPRPDWPASRRRVAREEIAVDQCAIARRCAVARTRALLSARESAHVPALPSARGRTGRRALRAFSGSNFRR